VYKYCFYLTDLDDEEADCYSPWVAGVRDYFLSGSAGQLSPVEVNDSCLQWPGGDATKGDISHFL